MTNNNEQTETPARSHRAREHTANVSPSAAPSDPRAGHARTPRHSELPSRKDTVQVQLTGSSTLSEPTGVRHMLGMLGSFYADSQTDLLDRWMLPLVIFYLEMIFKASTAGDFFPSVIYIVLFAIVLGRFLTLFTTLPFGVRVNSVVTKVILCGLGVLYGVEYFVYRQFKIYFDIKTVTAGAGHVAGGFMGDAIRLVFSPSGLVHVLLFLLPLILYFLVRHFGVYEPAQESARGRILIVVQCILAYLLALLLIAIPSPYRNAYWCQWNFATSVQEFGLSRTIGKALVNSSGEIAFESEENAEGPALSDYDDNVMDIDFDSLDQRDKTCVKLDEYVQGLTPSSQNEMTGLFAGKNLIFISAEAFSAEAIREDITPTLYRMATRGIQFTDYYQPSSAGTTGGECSNILGVLPFEGGESLKDVAEFNNYFTIGSALNRQGYNGWAFHNNDYTYYDRQLTHNNLGYNNGYMGYGNGMEDYVTEQWPQSDLEMVQGTFDEIYGTEAPFNVYYMSVSGHCDYDPEENDMVRKNWDAVADLDCSDQVKAYLACNVELDAAMEYLIGRLEELGIADDTVIVISADHFPYGLDDDAALGNMKYLSELYGYKVEDTFSRDHNRLIIWSGCLEDQEPIVVDDPVSSIDVLPTLLNLFGCEWDSRLLPGRDVFSNATPLVFDLSYNWRTDKGTYWAVTDTFEPNDGVTVDNGYVDRINTMVANKINYCAAVLTTDYFAHVFGKNPDVNEVNAAGKEENAALIEAAQASYAQGESEAAAE